MDNLARDILSVNEEIAGRHATTVADGADGAPEMIWGSPEMGAVLDLVGKVACRPATVLLMGETGTGKSMLAHVIHRDSPRRARPFLAQNCGALPEALCESELFGYRRGAFSGAVQDRQGLFEAIDAPMGPALYNLRPWFWRSEGGPSRAAEITTGAVSRSMAEGEITRWRRAWPERETRPQARTLTGDQQKNSSGQ